MSVEVIRVPADVLVAIRDHVESCFPEEACGMLLGRCEGIREVAVFHSVENALTSDRTTQYELNLPAQASVERAARAEGLEVLGYVHSHPGREAVPSARDRELAWKGVSYVIFPVIDGRAGEARSWRISGEREYFEEETIIS